MLNSSVCVRGGLFFKWFVVKQKNTPNKKSSANQFTLPILIFTWFDVLCLFIIIRYSANLYCIFYLDCILSAFPSPTDNNKLTRDLEIDLKFKILRERNLKCFLNLTTKLRDQCKNEFSDSIILQFFGVVSG